MNNDALFVPLILSFILLIYFMAGRALCIRIPDRMPEPSKDRSIHPSQTAVFALGSFWRSEAAFGCLDGVVRTTSGYAGGSKINPQYRSLGEHAESVQIEYDPGVISFKQLLEVFWSSHDPTQVFGPGPDVSNQYRSIIFTNGTEESRLAAVSKERQQTKSRKSILTTQIQQLEMFYSAEPEHQVSGGVKFDHQFKHALSFLSLQPQVVFKISVNNVPKFELKRSPFMLQLIGNLPQEELEKSNLAAKLNGYAAELCPAKIQMQIDTKISDIIGKGWPILREV